jgi:PAS domain S-box-containing protein
MTNRRGRSSDDDAGDVADAETMMELRAELEHVRARELRYRGLLEESQRHAEASHRLSETLSRLSLPLDSSSRKDDAEARGLPQILAASRAALNVTRVGLWLANRDQSAMECELLVFPDRVRTRPGLAISKSDAPRYFEAIFSTRALAVEDMFAHPSTQELRAYMDEHHVRSLLDVPVRVAGKTIGIICHERAAVSDWTEAEIAFAASIADLAAATLEHNRALRTQRSAAELAAQHNHLLLSLPLALYSFDVNGTIEYVSPGAEVLIGKDALHLVGPGGVERWMDRIHIDDRERILARLNDSIAHAGQPIEYRVRDGLGAERWVRDTYALVRGAAGRVLGVQGIIEDITERVVAEQSRAEWERRFRSILASLKDVVAVMIDEAGRVTYANDYFLELMGMQREEVIQADWLKLLARRSDPSGRRPAKRFEDRHSTVEFEEAAESRLQSAKSGTRLLRWSSTVLRSAEGRPIGVASLGVDLTDRDALERKEKRDESEETLGRMAAGVAHDLTNALTSLSLTVAFLRGPRAADEAARANALLNLESCIDRATEITRGLLDITREVVDAPTEVDLNEALDRCEPMLRAVTSDSPLKLTLRRASEPVFVFADTLQVQRVLLNLVTNARDAMPNGGNLDVRVERLYVDRRMANVTGVSLGAYGVIEVSDTGEGIPFETLPRVFDPYFTTKSNRGGTGLGLAASRAMVRRVGGEIHVESEPGRGTRFVVFLPIEG